MKTESEIRKRLSNLCSRYERKFISVSQERRHLNCVYNYEHKSTQERIPDSMEVELAPRKQTTLIIIQDDQPVHICTYGSQNPSTWSGRICDDDDIPKSCPYFKSKVSVDEAKNDFDSLLKNDEFVYDNYRDIAALQWVLEDRYYKFGPQILDKFFNFIFRKMKKPEKLVQSTTENVDDTSSNTRS